MTIPTEGESRSAIPPFSAVGLCALSAIAMCHGWGWRGSYGHEAGAMLPGAMLAMCICLVSGRTDLYRRTTIAGLLGAVLLGVHLVYRKIVY